MSCTDKRNQIADLLSGGLNDEQTREVMNHLDSCPQCKAYMQQLQDEDRTLSQWVDSLEPELQQGCQVALEQLRASGKLQSKSSKPSLFHIRWLQSAVAAVIILTAGVLIGQRFQASSIDPAQLEQQLTKSIESSLQDQMTRTLATALYEMNSQTQEQMLTLIGETMKASDQQINLKLAELMDVIYRSQLQERERFLMALKQIDTNRQKDNNQIRNDLLTFAQLTDNELNKTRRQMVQLLSDENPKPNIQ